MVRRHLHVSSRRRDRFCFRSRQRFLEAFRRRSEHASAIDPAMRRQMAERLVAEFGTCEAAADALWAIARPNRWSSEAEAAEEYLCTD
ncbi:K07154 [Sinorhizobium fredii HH103]|uniref:K07154 n=1 Tax=Sinorhizobium fredii (strain HH103) TaxID=1117943 RepID=G9A2P5_SINF1|nr:K07154 [Sinorhizobium fredii HH103]